MNKKTGIYIPANHLSKIQFYIVMTLFSYYFLWVVVLHMNIVRETQMNLIMNFLTKEQQLQQYKKTVEKKCHLSIQPAASIPPPPLYNMITLNQAYRVLYVKRWWCTRVFSKSKVLIHIVSILYLKVNTILSSLVLW